MSAIATLLLVGCGGANRNYETLISNEWSLESIVADDESYTLKPDAEITIQFGDSSTFSGNGGCNGYFGVYSTDEDLIDIETQGRTMAMCEHIDFEDKYLSMLEDCSTFYAQGNELQLNNNEVGVTLIFKAIKK